MQTSFIPKKPITESHSAGPGISLFLLISIIVLIVSLALAGYVWLMQQSLTKQIIANTEKLAKDENAYKKATINPLIRLNDKMVEANNLLENHVAVTPVFALLEENVLKNVQLKNMKFSKTEDGQVKINLSGIADTYDVLSKQSEAFGDEDLKIKKLISEPVITDFSPLTDGRISFNFSASIGSELVTYKNTLESADVSTLTSEDPLPPVVDDSATSSASTATGTVENI